jgi:hypothetical protein
MAKAKPRKSSVSVRDKRVRRSRAAREARHEAHFERALRNRLDGLSGVDGPPHGTATLWLEQLDGDPVPLKISRMLAVNSTAEHAHAVAVEMERLAPGSVPALTLAADVAFQLDGDARQASTWIDRAMEISVDSEARVALAEHLLEIGRAADALLIVEERLLDLPEDDEAERIYAGALELAGRRIASGAAVAGNCPCWSGRCWSDCCRDAERHALERFTSRSQLDSLHEAMLRFTTSMPDLHTRVKQHVEQWLSGASEFAHDAGARERLVQAATEHAWLVGGEHEHDDQDAPLALFATSRSAEPATAAAARRWFANCEYGLWQVNDPTPTPGVWLVDLLTGTRRYVAIPPEQLEGIGRWTVLVGALAATDGIWRSASPLIPLRPTEADAVAEVAEELVCRVASAASGAQISSNARGWSREEPAGVLAPQSEPASPAVASFCSKVLGSAMPQLLSVIAELRHAAPQLVTPTRTRCA